MNNDENVKLKYQLLGCAGNNPNCGVVAVAYLAGKPVGEVFQDFKKTFGRGNSWKGRTHTYEQTTMMKKYGVKYEGVDLHPKINTFSQWLRYAMDPSKTYRVTVTGHVMVVDKGHVIDQQTLTHYRELKTGLRKKVQMVLEIL